MLELAIALFLYRYYYKDRKTIFRNNFKIMSPYEECENNNKTTIEEETEISKIESEISGMANNVREEIKIIKSKIKKLNGFQEIEESNSNTFIRSFESNIEKVESSFNFLLEYKNKFIDLYNEKYGNYSENNVAYENNNLDDHKDEKINILEIKEEIEKARSIILNTFPDIIRSLNALGDGKDLQKAFIKVNINELESIESGIEKLSRCKEMISEFCE